MKARGTASLNYILFNTLWDRAVGNTLDQFLRTHEYRYDDNLYVQYLENSISSVVESGAEYCPAIIIWLAIVDRNGIDAGHLKQHFKCRFPMADIVVNTIGYDLIGGFVNRAFTIPRTSFRSSNELHEFLFMHVLKNVDADKAAIVDPDVYFLTGESLSHIFSLLDAHPQKWVAAFIDRNIKRFAGNQSLPPRERLQSVAVFLDTRLFREGFVDPDPWDENLPGKARHIRNPECSHYYTRYGFYDTFSLLTDYLKYHFGQDRLLALNDHLEFAEGADLTLLSNHVVHSKYLIREGFSSLMKTIATGGFKLNDQHGLTKLVGLASAANT